MPPGSVLVLWLFTKNCNFHVIFVFPLVFLQAPLDHSSEATLSDSGFEPGGKKNFLQLTDKDGEQPQIASVISFCYTVRCIFFF